MNLCDSKKIRYKSKLFVRVYRGFYILSRTLLNFKGFQSKTPSKSQVIEMARYFKGLFLLSNVLHC